MYRLLSYAKVRQKALALKCYQIGPETFTHLFSNRFHGSFFQHSEREGAPPRSQAGRRTFELAAPLAAILDTRNGKASVRGLPSGTG